MTMQDTRRPALTNDLYIRSEELPGKPAAGHTMSDGVEADADALVKQLLIEEKRRESPGKLPEIAPQEDVLVFDAQDPENMRETPRESIAQILKAERAAANPPARRSWFRLPKMKLPRFGLPTLRRPRLRQARPAETSAPKESDRRGLRLPAWLRSYRPTRKHVFWVVVAGLVLWRPLMMPLVILLLIWVVLIAYLTLGPERSGEIIGGLWHRLHVRRPELAERLRARADVFAERFDRVLDYLPETWADRLALPDFSKAGEEDDRPDPFERLSAEARQA